MDLDGEDTFPFYFIVGMRAFEPAHARPWDCPLPAANRHRKVLGQIPHLCFDRLHKNNSAQEI